MSGAEIYKKRARIQPITTTTQKEWNASIILIDTFTNEQKTEALGPFTLPNLIPGINKKLKTLAKDYPNSLSLKKLIDSFKKTRTKLIEIALNNKVYCIPELSLNKCNSLEPCALNNGKNIVLAQISNEKKISFFLRMHILPDRYNSFVDVQILVPSWLEDDIRVAMANLIAIGNEKWMPIDNINQINKFNSLINSDIHYIYQLKCPTFKVYLEEPTPKVEPDYLFDTDLTFDDLFYTSTFPPDLEDVLQTFETPLAELSTISPLLFSSTDKDNDLFDVHTPSVDWDDVLRQLESPSERLRPISPLLFSSTNTNDEPNLHFNRATSTLRQ